MREHAVVAIAALLAAALPAQGADLNETLRPVVGAAHARSGDVAGTRVDYAALRGDPQWTGSARALSRRRSRPPAIATRSSRTGSTPTTSSPSTWWCRTTRRRASATSVRCCGRSGRSDGRHGRRAQPLARRDRARHPATDGRAAHPHGDRVCVDLVSVARARAVLARLRLDAQLDAAARGFVANPGEGRARRGASACGSRRSSTGSATISRRAAACVAFVRRHAEPELARADRRARSRPGARLVRLRLVAQRDRASVAVKRYSPRWRAGRA